MRFPSKALEEAVNAISLLPGVGKKTALRMALHLVQDNFQKANRIVNALTCLQDDIQLCKHCHVISDHDICDICSVPMRNNGILCVVEGIRDMMAIEDTNQFNGRYHLLGGVISPIDGIGPAQLNIDSLINRISAEGITEVIMALTPSIDSDTTIYYISKKLDLNNVKISGIARGISFGGELEYADEFTLGKSISARTPISTIND